LGFSNLSIIEKEIKPDTEEKFDFKSLPQDEKIEDLVKEISPEKTPNKDDSPHSKQEKSFGKNIIVSETLAKIYISQGEYKEAIDIYNLLKEKHPNKVEYYSSKIEELKSKLD
jgi:hypothetical protein